MLLFAMVLEIKKKRESGKFSAVIGLSTEESIPFGLYKTLEYKEW